MRTMSFPDYRRDQLEIPRPDSQHAKGATIISGGLSAFNVPESVEADVSPSLDRCVFRFQYSDGEDADSAEYILPDNKDLSFRLGKHSKKIIEVHMKNASGRLERGRLSFDPRLVWRWAKDMPDRPRKILTRNAQVIAFILSTMPDSVRETLRSALSGNDDVAL